jgi:ESCRT-I complex subunit VPS28
MDSLKLDMKAVDQLQPLLVDILSNLNAIPSMNDLSGKDKITAWLTVLNRMDASDELNSNQTRQMLFDLESAYNTFYKSLSN